MNKTTVIYHNPRCSKSRAALGTLQEEGLDLEVVEYLKTPPTAEELEEILNKLNKQPRDLMRKGEAEYQELDLATRELSRQQLIDIMVANPKLIERPIVIRGEHAVVARPPQTLESILQS